MELMKFLKESREELKKVIWPNREEVLTSTLVVLATIFVISLFLFFLDNFFDAIFQYIIKVIQ